MNTILKFVGNKMMLKKLTLQLVETSYKGKNTENERKQDCGKAKYSHVFTP